MSPWTWGTGTEQVKGLPGLQGLQGPRRRPCLISLLRKGEKSSQARPCGMSEMETAELRDDLRVLPLGIRTRLVAGILKWLSVKNYSLALFSILPLFVWDADA